MFSFLKIGKNLLKTVLNNNPEEILANFYQHTDLKKANWVSLAVNKSSVDGSMLTKEVEIHTICEAYSLKIAEKAGLISHQIWQNRRSLAQIRVPLSSEFNQSYNQLINQLVSNNLTIFQLKLNQELRSEPFSREEIAQDEKALEWMKVSFLVLEKAIIESLTNPELIFQTLLFFGINPKSQKLEIRLITFNLDIKYEFLDNGMLRVRIYNDKDGAFGSNKKAALEGDFNFRKREMLDELTKLLSAVSKGIMLH